MDLNICTTRVLTSTRRPKNVLTLTKVLAESLGVAYVEMALDT